MKINCDLPVGLVAQPAAISMTAAASKILFNMASDRQNLEVGHFSLTRKTGLEAFLPGKVKFIDTLNLVSYGDDTRHD